MNNYLRYLFNVVLAMVSITASAEGKTVVIDFNAMTDLPMSWSKTDTEEASEAGHILEEKTIIVDEVKIVISPKEENNKNENRFWRTSNGPQLRCYSGTMKMISSMMITHVEFDAPNKWDMSSTPGTCASKIWDGETPEIMFTFNANTQINRITVKLGGNPESYVETPDGLYYYLIPEEGVAEVVYNIRNHDSYRGAVSIPETLTYNGVDYTVTSINDNAFENCSSLTSITIPNSVTSIGDGAFQGCSGLTSVTIPNSVTSIGKEAFSGCSGLTSVTIPNSVTSIGVYAFQNCSSLTSVTIPNSVTTIGDGAFYGCSGLTSVTISNSVTTLESRVFEGCSSLTSVTIPNSVTTIGYGAFQNCSSLTSVTIPGSVKRIDLDAFYECFNLVSVISKMDYPCTINSECFPNNVFNNSTLYIPKGTFERYKMKDYWNKFENIVEGEPSSDVDPGATKCATPIISYSNKELTFSCATEGVDYKYTITDSDIKTDYASKVSLSATYEISVYAMKEGLGNSDVATATLVWTDAIFTETTPETPTSAKAVQESIPVLISAKGGNISVKCEADGQEVNVYTIDGLSLGTATVKNGEALISTSIPSGDIAVVKVGGRSVKVIMR